ncbi:MAG: ATP-binding cassette domain-containing protein [Candidatus Kapaibacterium sp.]|nr:MAG: ATP-binding cassette domain-containing protein [Candidatus Kapabacteria bacterium]
MVSFLEFQNVSAGYGEQRVLQNISFQLPTACIHGLVGRNGQGKTTLLNLLRKYIRPFEGEILFCGAEPRKEDIAMLEVEPFFYPRMTGSEYLRLVQFANPTFRAEAWNAIFDVPLEEEIDTYSAGMRKKLAFMGVVGLRRPLVLLDEPFNSLDIETNYALTDILKLLTEQGTTVVLTSHIVEPLLAVSNTILYLQQGDTIHHFSQQEFDRIHALMRSKEHTKNLALLRETMQ